uniref:Uncharacterized protein n=1 Tax=Timema genevievae TaxID=629358 RepID=A0A7R9JQA4_TIMGE|nr:unnamed protein product [Timema genevievae]
MYTVPTFLDFLCVRDHRCSSICSFADGCARSLRALEVLASSGSRPLSSCVRASAARFTGSARRGLIKGSANVTLCTKKPHFRQSVGWRKRDRGGIGSNLDPKQTSQANRLEQGIPTWVPESCRNPFSPTASPSRWRQLPKPLQHHTADKLLTSCNLYQDPEVPDLIPSTSRFIYEAVGLKQGRLRIKCFEGTKVIVDVGVEDRCKGWVMIGLTAETLVVKDSSCQKKRNHFNLEVECLVVANSHKSYITSASVVTGSNALISCWARLPKTGILGLGGVVSQRASFLLNLTAEDGEIKVVFAREDLTAKPEERRSRSIEVSAPGLKPKHRLLDSQLVPVCRLNIPGLLLTVADMEQSSEFGAPCGCGYATPIR